MLRILHPTLLLILSLSASARELSPAGVSREGSAFLRELGIEMALVPAGSFQMGSPEAEMNRGSGEDPLHEVQLSACWMGCTEVSNRQYQAFLRENPDWRKGRVPPSRSDEDYLKDWTGLDYPVGKGDHPVTWVSWHAGQAFCDWLSRKTGKPFQLPTEAQWEKACRAGTRTAYCWGDDPDDGQGRCNGADLTAKQKYPSWTSFDWRDGHVRTSPVGAFQANAWGLHDMHGNVWEWCLDRYGRNYYASSPSQDPQGPSSGATRVLRGGSCYNFPRFLRSACRIMGDPTFTSEVVGFRVSLAPGASPLLPGP